MFLGIDIGTSAVKAVIADDAQTIIDQASMPLSVSRPHPLWVEQSPEDWWAAVQGAVMALKPINRSGVKAIGLTGQMHGTTCLGDKDKVLRAAILWNDGRSEQDCADMMAEHPNFPQIAGNLAMPGFTAPKLRWLKNNEADVFSQIKKVLLPKDYVRLKMSGDYASDMSDSAGTLWMDIGARDWSDELLSLTDLTRGHMPALYEGTEATGVLKADIAARWGMSQVMIAAGGGDNAAGAVGSGITAHGDGFLSLGTSGVIFLADNSYNINPKRGVHTFCHALPNTWHQMSVMLSAASAIDFVAKLTGFASPADLYKAAEQAGKPSGDTYFLPYLSGERTPHNDPKAKGAFFGLTHADDRVTLAQAALEGVAFALADCLDALRDGSRGAGAEVDALSVIGGGTRSQYWGRILASMFNVPLYYRSGAAVGPAFGAARLARLAYGSEAIKDICTPPPIEHVVEPDADLRDYYAQRRPVFQALYQETKGLLTA